MARGADGRWTAPDATPIYQHAKAAGLLYQAHLRAPVRERVPWVRWGPVRNGMAEIEQLSPEVLREFSTRRRQRHARHGHRRRPDREACSCAPTPAPNADAPRSTTSTDARSLPAAPANSATSERRWSACRARCAAVTTRTSPRIASMSSATVAPPTSSPLTPAPPAPRRGADSAERALQRQRLKLAEGEIAAAAERERNLASSIPDHTAWEAERGPLRQRAGELEAQLSGDLPDKPRARRTWQHAATRIEAYRFDHAVIDIRNALGPPPSDTQGRALATRPPRPPTRSARPRPP